MTLQDYIEEYIRRGYHPIPLKPLAKNPTTEGWPERHFSVSDFAPNNNVGLGLLNILEDVDTDCPEAALLAPTFLPKTGLICGRASKQNSHLFFKANDNKYKAFKDHGPKNTSKKPILELRVGNAEAMVPPSIWTDKDRQEQLEWSEFGEPSSEDPLRGCILTAIAVLITRYYPKEGERHEWSLALWGFLRKKGVSREEAELLCKTAGAADTKIHDRLEELKTTYNADESARLLGKEKLIELAGTVFVKDLTAFFVGEQKKNGLAYTDKGKPINNRKNMLAALIALDVNLMHNQLKLLPEVRHGDKVMSVDDDVLNRLRFSIDDKFDFLPSKELFFDTAYDEAFRHAYHPILDYLDALPPWDMVQRLDMWLIIHGGAKNTAYVRAVSSIPLIAAIRRVKQPGCNFQELLILESSSQGKGKSLSIEALCPDPSWYSNELPLGVDSQRVIEHTSGKWIIEAAELFGISRREVDAMKSFLSRSTDGPVRGAFKRMPKEVPRKFIIIGTTNRKDYLRDATGNRRYWPVEIVQLDVAGVKANRDKLWAEAVAREAMGESIRLDPNLYSEAGEEQNERFDVDDWDDQLDEFLKKTVFNSGGAYDLRGYGQRDGEWVALVAEELYDPDRLNIPIERRDERSRSRLNRIMTRRGWEKATVRRNEATMSGWRKRIPNKLLFKGKE